MMKKKTLEIVKTMEEMEIHLELDHKIQLPGESINALVLQVKHIVHASMEQLLVQEEEI